MAWGGDDGDDASEELGEPEMSALPAPHGQARKTHGRDNADRMEWLPGMFLSKKRHKKRWVAWEAKCLHSTHDLSCQRARNSLQPLLLP